MSLVLRETFCGGRRFAEIRRGVVTADLSALTRVWLGGLPLAEARRAGAVRLDGARDLVRDFPGWLMLSIFADVRRPAAAG